jgi:hypothetical protein
MSCINTPCDVLFASTVQVTMRSSADYTSFIEARTVYSYTNNTSNTYQQIGLPPRFNSHTDYLKYKRANTQLNATVFK